jgi:transposase
MLMPADPRDWLPDGHLAWKVLELAREMDLSRFGAHYRPDGQGGRPYHPQMMAALLLYCCCLGRKSSREIEMATSGDVGARIICGAHKFLRWVALARRAPDVVNLGRAVADTHKLLG